MHWTSLPLYRSHVPRIELGLYSYGSGLETPRRMLTHCQNKEARRSKLKNALGERLDLKELLDTRKVAAVANQWVVRLGRL